MNVEINQIPVNSSNLSSVGYDSKNRILEVHFHSGLIYQYFQVPQYLFDGILGAPSHGKYLDAHIKKAGYAYEKIF